MKKSLPKNYWFKRRRYGYGWTPVTYQGWSVIGVFLVIILGGTYFLKNISKNTYTDEVGLYIVMVGAAVVGLIAISLEKGPKPKWRWGKQRGDNSKEDF